VLFKIRDLAGTARCQDERTDTEPPGLHGKPRWCGPVRQARWPARRSYRALFDLRMSSSVRHCSAQRRPQRGIGGAEDRRQRRGENAVLTADPRDAREFSMVSLDLKNEEAAVELAKRLAEQTGCTVTVRDADGELVGTFGGHHQN
jgi:hypothetical protein